MGERKGCKYAKNGFRDMARDLAEQEYPLPSNFECLLKESLQPFYNKIKY